MGLKRWGNVLHRTLTDKFQVLYVGQCQTKCVLPTMSNKMCPSNNVKKNVSFYQCKRVCVLTMLTRKSNRRCPSRGGSRNSLKGGGVLGQNSSKGGGGVRVQVRGNFHILTSKKTTKNNLWRGGLNPNPPPPGSATAFYQCQTEGVLLTMSNRRFPSSNNVKQKVSKF